MNILTTNGYVARYVTDWAGPEAMLRTIEIRLGAPAIPGHPLRFTGHVVADRREGDERVLEVACAPRTRSARTPPERSRSRSRDAMLRPQNCGRSTSVVWSRGQPGGAKNSSAMPSGSRKLTPEP